MLELDQLVPFLEPGDQNILEAAVLALSANTLVVIFSHAVNHDMTSVCCPSDSPVTIFLVCIVQLFHTCTVFVSPVEVIDNEGITITFVFFSSSIFTVADMLL
ncbi:MAG: hypothetical protein WCJ81_01775 [bacterium]